jgi:two-component system cell cycle response regulator CpdR
MSDRVSSVNRTVLIVDDDAHVLDISAIIVANLGYTAVCASAGQDALKVIESDPSVDILLTDIKMPGMHGFELARRAKAIRTDIRVVYVTGHTSLMPDRTGETFGPILRKPFRPHDLAAYLRLVEDC